MATREELMNAYSRTGVRGMILAGQFDSQISEDNKDQADFSLRMSKPLNREFAIFGDSRTAQCHTISTTAISTENYGYAFWASQVSGGYCPAAFNFGVGGDTTAMMLARISSVVACSADIVLFMGGTNDRTSGMTVADTKRNIIAIVRRLQKAGKIVIVGNDTPRFGTKALTTQQQIDHETIRDWVTNELSKITLVADTYSRIIQSDLHDDLHVAVKGAYKVGALGFGVVLSKYINLSVDLPTDSTDIYSINNITGSLITNPLLTGNVIQNTGSVNPLVGSVVATGFKGAGSNLAGLNTEWYKEIAPFGESQCIKFSGASTSAGSYIAFTPTAVFDLSNVSTGNVLSLMAGYDLVGDGNGILGVTAEFLVTKPVNSVSTNFYYRDGDKYVDPHSMPTGTISGALDTQRYTIDGTETAILPRISVYFAQNIQQSSELKIHQIAVRKHVA